MSFAVALVLAAAAAHAAPAGGGAQQANRGAQVDTARISATILRPAVVERGVLVSTGTAGAPHSQIVRSDSRVTYEFE